MAINKRNVLDVEGFLGRDLKARSGCFERRAGFPGVAASRERPRRSDYTPPEGLALLASSAASSKRQPMQLRKDDLDVLRLLQEIPGVTAEPTAFTKRRLDIVIRATDVTHVVEV